MQTKPLIIQEQVSLTPYETNVLKDALLTNLLIKVEEDYASSSNIRLEDIRGSYEKMEFEIIMAVSSFMERIEYKVSFVSSSDLGTMIFENYAGQMFFIPFEEARRLISENDEAVLLEKYEG